MRHVLPAVWMASHVCLENCQELAVDAKKSALGVTDSTAADGGTETVTNHDRYLDLIHQRAAPVRRRTPTSTRLPCLNQTPSAVFDPNPFNDTPADTVDLTYLLLISRNLLCVLILLHTGIVFLKHFVYFILSCVTV